MACINRTVEDVESLIEYAKLTSDSLLGTTQTLEFPEDYDPTTTMLIQLPPKLLNTLKKGDEMVLRGEPDDFAVLCTDNETFEVREAETSNSLLLIPGLKLPEQMSKENENRVIVNREVTGIHYKYLELKECLPRLHKLRQLLAECPYGGPCAAISKEQSNKLLTMCELLDKVQCSDEQLREALVSLPALRIDGNWRVLEFDYKFKVVSDILGIIEDNQWPLDNISKKDIFQRLDGVEPKEVVELCLGYYFKANDESNEDVLALNDDRVSRLFAEVLLKPTGKFNLTEFLTIWEQSVPQGVMTELSQLEGLALVDRSSSPAIISHCPVESLPQEPALRFQHLFDLKDKWTAKEIMPYVQDLASAKCSAISLLAKFARGSTHNGIKHYTGKHTR